MAKKYTAPEFAGGRTPRRTNATPARKAGKVGQHNPIPLAPRVTATTPERPA